ncbi:hypothetical protein X777_03714 [Ooceraea biroi]|uniref:Uncharacterized protein n=1 Tax=Ooceraea biroi TaxID=2015173 RepID=A0A026WLQ3_OOCBI|nr:hypothetical protein X777_03714 [Ooceraea biroi]
MNLHLLRSFCVGRCDNRPIKRSFSKEADCVIASRTRPAAVATNLKWEQCANRVAGVHQEERRRRRFGVSAGEEAKSARG